jgi:hypothetical protein
MRLNLAIGSRSVRALPLTEEGTCFRIEAFSQRLELVLPNVTFQPEKFCPASSPLAFYSFALRIVVAVFEVPGRVASPIPHGPNREHATSPAYRNAQ